MLERATKRYTCASFLSILTLTYAHVQFFINFLQAASVYTIYNCVTMLVFVVLRATSSDHYIDPQKIVVVALYVGVDALICTLCIPDLCISRAGIFAMFTTVMQFSHFRLIWHGQTTVESIRAHRMRHREKQAMNDVIGYWSIVCGFPKACVVHVTQPLLSERNDERCGVMTRSGVGSTKKVTFGGWGAERKGGLM